MDLSAILAFTKQFLKHNPSHPDYNNLLQYTDITNLQRIYGCYQQLINESTGSILDIGSGIGFAKMIDKSIHTANMHVDYFIEIEEMFGVEKDIFCRDCTKFPKWVMTDQQFDSIILHKFLPWDNNVTNQTLFNIFSDVDRLLNDGGYLLYTPINIQKLHTKHWQKIQTGMYSYKITKQQVHDAANTYKIL